MFNFGKKSIVFYSFLIFAPAIFAACTIPFFGQKQPEPVTIKYWGLWESKEVMEQVFAKYTQANPHVTIAYELNDPRDYRERLQARIAQGSGPDIFRFHNTWVPMLKTELAQIPSSVIDSQTFKNSFYPVAVTDLQAPEGFWGIPLEFDGLGLYYNVDLLKAAGITAPPANWDQLRTTAATLTVKDEAGKIKTSGVALGTADNIDHFSDILAVMMLQNGVDLKNIATGDEKRDGLAVDALDFYTLFAKSGEARTWDDTLESSTLAFAAGKLAFYFGPSWRAFEIKTANPTLAFKIAPIPQLPGERINWATYWVEGVSAKSKVSKEAFKLLKFLSQEDTLQTFYTEAAKIRLFGEPYPLVSLGGSIAQDPFVGAYIQQAPTAQSFPAVAATFDNGLNDRIINFFKDAVNSVNSGTNTKTALETLSKGISQVYSQFGITSPATQ